MLHRLLRLMLGLLFRVQVTGDSDQLLRGRPLVVCNHDSLLDTLLVAAYLPGAPIVVMPRAIERHWSARLVRRIAECRTFGPGSGLVIKGLVRDLRQGRPVVVFPQERVSTTGGIMKIYATAGVVAARANADIIPLCIRGTLFSRFSVTSARWPRSWRPQVTLTVLPAVRLPPLPAGAVVPRRHHFADAMLQILQRAAVDAEPQRPLFSALLDAVERYGRRTRIVEDVRQQEQTYGDLLKGSLALGRLTASFTAPGECVGVLLPNVIANVCLVFGLASRGRVSAMLNYSSGAEAVRGACEGASINTVITSRAFVEAAHLEPLLPAFEGRRVVYLEDLRAGLTLADKLWIVGAVLRPRRALPEQDPAATAIVLFTSGSEARPKGVAISHRGMLSGMAQLRAVIDFGPDDKYLNALPMFHTFGLISCTLMPLLYGTRLFLYTSPLHYKVIPEFAYTRDCTYIFGTSTFLGNYARQAHPYDFYRARIVIAGGEKLNPEVAQLWQAKFGLRVYEGYGATECGPAMSLNTPLAFCAGSVGRLLPGIESRIVPVPGIEHGGALHVRGPNLMQGYFLHDRPGVLQSPSSEIGDGWYNTGDVVNLDDEGFLTIQGRVKRFAKIAGELVSLEHVEHIACQASPEYRHAALVEMTHVGESTVLMTTDPALDRITLQHAARQINARDLAVARRIVKVDALPLLGSGKVDYVSLKQLAVP